MARAGCGRLLAVRGRRQGLRRSAQSFVLGLRYPRARGDSNAIGSAARACKKLSPGAFFCSVSSESGMNFSRALHKSDTGASSLDTPAALKCIRVSAAHQTPRELCCKNYLQIYALRNYEREEPLSLPEA